MAAASLYPPLPGLPPTKAVFRGLSGFRGQQGRLTTESTDFFFVHLGSDHETLYDRARVREVDEQADRKRARLEVV